MINLRAEANAAEPVAYAIKASNTLRLCSVYLASEAEEHCISEYRKDLVVPLYAQRSGSITALEKVRRILTNGDLHETTRVVDAIDAIDAALSLVDSKLSEAKEEEGAI